MNNKSKTMKVINILGEGFGALLEIYFRIFVVVILSSVGFILIPGVFIELNAVERVILLCSQAYFILRPGIRLYQYHFSKY